MPIPSRFLTACLVLPLLGACEQIAELDGSKARNADALAVGSACRHAGRALEDCYTMNPEAPKAQVFAGWKEMNDYMTEKKIDVVPPAVGKALPRAADKGADKGADKALAGSDKFGRIERAERAEVSVKSDLKADTTQYKGSGLPTTSAAAADPLIGLKAGQPGSASAAGEKPGTAAGDKAGSRQSADNRAAR
jgi:hypothetical protein